MPQQSGAAISWKQAALLLLSAALLFFASPFFDWLISTVPAWYVLYCLWGILIVVAFLLQRTRRRDDI